METRKTLSGRLFEPVDAASVVAFRIGFGLLMTIAVARFFAHGSIAEYFVQPRYFFPYSGFEWVRPWPGAGMYVHFAAMGLLALLVTCGAFYRIVMPLFGALFAYAHLVDKTNYLNHYYLVICLCLLMSLTPLHRLASVDVWRKPELSARAVPAWVLLALRAQVGLVYVFGGIAKLKPDWLLSAQPMKIWLSANTDFPVLGRFFDQEWTAYALSYAGAAFDLSVVPLLLWKRSRPFAYAAVFVFHLATARLFQLGMFPWIMMTSSLLFLSPDWPRRLMGKVHALLLRRAAFAPSEGVSVAPMEKKPLVLALLAVYFAAHLLVPLRHLVYPGNVLWTEQGFRFSWNVMLMEKDASAEFRVTEPSTGRTWIATPAEYLTRYQTKMMSTQPDMIVQFAHVVADDFRGRGVRDPRVYADVFASLNGRPQARLVDSEVDLAQESDGVTPKRWILPMTDSPENDVTRLARSKGQ